MKNSLERFIYEAIVKEVVLQAVALIVVEASTGTVLYASPKAEALFGYDSEGLLEQNINELIPQAVQVKPDDDLATDINEGVWISSSGSEKVFYAQCRNAAQAPVRVEIFHRPYLQQGLVIVLVNKLHELEYASAALVAQVSDSTTDTTLATGDTVRTKASNPSLGTSGVGRVKKLEQIE